MRTPEIGRCCAAALLLMMFRQSSPVGANEPAYKPIDRSGKREPMTVVEPCWGPRVPPMRHARRATNPSMRAILPTLRRFGNVSGLARVSARISSRAGVTGAGSCLSPVRPRDSLRGYSSVIMAHGPNPRSPRSCPRNVRCDPRKRSNSSRPAERMRPLRAGSVAHDHGTGRHLLHPLPACWGV